MAELAATRCKVYLQVSSSVVVNQSSKIVIYMRGRNAPRVGTGAGARGEEEKVRDGE